MLERSDCTTLPPWLRSTSSSEFPTSSSVAGRVRGSTLRALPATELIVPFCPLDAYAAAQELAGYGKHCAEFVKRDAWLPPTLNTAMTCPLTGRAEFLTIPDPEGTPGSPSAT